MPGRDGRGPLGYGSRTGKSLGLCNRSVPTSARGFGYFCRRNFGRFLSRLNHDVPIREDLEHERRILKQEIENIDREIQNIDNNNGNT